MDLLITCKPNYETILTRELLLHNYSIKESGNCWILAQSPASCEALLNQNIAERETQLCFAQTILINPIKINASSVNEFAGKLADFFLDSMKGKHIENNLLTLFLHADIESLSPRAKLVESTWRNKISKKMSRVGKLLKKPAPLSSKPIEGFFTYFSDFNQAFIAGSAIIGPCLRMHMDKNAPSRSYLKAEEAYILLNCQPQANEQVVDLGAAPGGWTYSALKRKAKVIAIDNARMNKAIANHPNITHLKQDALKFTPGNKLNIDWLFCDIIEQPEIILQVVHRWLKHGWCQKFIVNLKIGRCDPLAIIKKINDPDTGLIGYCSVLKIRQLYHDRQEITVTGKII
ncbi:MAG: SAM-dependent methyltransferase [Candidatus Omnitrophota bacterium]